MNNTTMDPITDDSFPDRARAEEIADKVEQFVRDVIVPYEQDPRRDHHDCPTDELTRELRQKASAAGVLTPHIFPEGGHLSQRGTAMVLIRSGLSPLAPWLVTPPHLTKATCSCWERWAVI